LGQPRWFGRWRENKNKKRKGETGPWRGPVHGPTWPLGHARVHDREDRPSSSPRVLARCRTEKKKGRAGRRLTCGTRRTTAKAGQGGGEVGRCWRGLGAFLSPGSGFSRWRRPRSTSRQGDGGGGSGEPGRQRREWLGPEEVGDRHGEEKRGQGRRGRAQLGSPTLTVTTACRGDHAGAAFFSEQQPEAGFGASLGVSGEGEEWWECGEEWQGWAFYSRMEERGWWPWPTGERARGGRGQWGGEG
jgi:hypothetical protein